MKKCYNERNKDNIETFSKLLFREDHKPIIIGTSNDEWCFGIKESEQLFLSDWDGWGNVSMDTNSAIFGNCGEYSWFYVPGSVEYSFENNDDTYSAFMKMTLEIADNPNTPLTKAGDILWLLTHLLHDRPPGERKYRWDMTISGILEDVDSSLTVRILQFSMPVMSAYPDVRTDTSQEDWHTFQEECRKIREYNASNSVNHNTVIAEQLSRFFDKDKRVKFIYDDKKRYIGCDGNPRSGTEYLEYLENMREKGTEAIFQKEDIIVTNRKSAFTFCGVGLFTRDILLETELNNIFSCMECYNCLESKKEALFCIRRDIVLALKESAPLTRSSMPFRIEGVGSVSDNMDLNIEYMQISYPFNHVLEQKTDASVLI